MQVRKTRTSPLQMDIMTYWHSHTAEYDGVESQLLIIPLPVIFKGSMLIEFVWRPANIIASYDCFCVICVDRCRCLESHLLMDDIHIGHAFSQEKIVKGLLASPLFWECQQPFRSNGLVHVYASINDTTIFIPMTCLGMIRNDLQKCHLAIITGKKNLIEFLMHSISPYYYLPLNKSCIFWRISPATDSLLRNPFNKDLGMR